MRAIMLLCLALALVVAATPILADRFYSTSDEQVRHNFAAVDHVARHPAPLSAH